MSIRDNLDISAYLVLGPENTLGRPVGDVVAQALDAGFTCIQVRSKVASAREIIALTGDAAQAIAQAGKTGQVALLIDDRLDCVLAARERQYARQGADVCNAAIPPPQLAEHCPLSADASRMFAAAFQRLGLTARAHDRVLRVARTIADLADSSVIEAEHLAEALQYRSLDRAAGS